jgi:hypothetical protein
MLCTVHRSSTNNRWSMEQTTISSAPQLVIPSPPWKSSSSTNILPKYSPAFKRKSLTVYGSTGPGQEELQPLFPICRHSAEAPASLESITSPTRYSFLSFLLIFQSFCIFLFCLFLFFFFLVLEPKSKAFVISNLKRFCKLYSTSCRTPYVKDQVIVSCKPWAFTRQHRH